MSRLCGFFALLTLENQSYDFIFRNWAKDIMFSSLPIDKEKDEIQSKYGYKYGFGKLSWKEILREEIFEFSQIKDNSQKNIHHRVRENKFPPKNF